MWSTYDSHDAGYGFAHAGFLFKQDFEASTAHRVNVTVQMAPPGSARMRIGVSNCA